MYEEKEKEKEIAGGSETIANTEVVEKAIVTRGERLKPYQFKPGNQAAKGHKNAATSLAYKRLLREQVTEDRWREIVLKAIEQAAEGDDKARKWLSDILIAKNIKMAGAMGRVDDVQGEIDRLFGLMATVERGDDADADSNPA